MNVDFSSGQQKKKHVQTHYFNISIRRRIMLNFLDDDQIYTSYSNVNKTFFKRTFDECLIWLTAFDMHMNLKHFRMYFYCVAMQHKCSYHVHVFQFLSESPLVSLRIPKQRFFNEIQLRISLKETIQLKNVCLTSDCIVRK